MQIIGNPNFGYHVVLPSGNLLCGNTDVLHKTVTTEDGEPTCEACKKLLTIIPDAVYLAVVYPGLPPKQAFEHYQFSQNVPGFSMNGSDSA